MKKLSVVLIVILAIAAVALGGLYYTSNADKNAQIDSLTADVAGKAAEIEALTADVTVKAAEIEGLNADVAGKAAEIDTLNAAAVDAAAKIDELNAAAADAAASIEALNADVADKAAEIDALTAAAAEDAAAIEALNNAAVNAAAQIEDLTNAAAEKDAAIAELQGKLDYAGMDEAALLAVVDEITPPLEALGYEVSVAVPAPVPAEELAAETEADAEAPAEEGVLSFVHPRGGFGFSYPADMVLMSKDNIDELIDMMLNGELAMDGVDVSVLQSQAASIQQQDMTMLIGGGGLMNVNCTYTYIGVNLTPEQFIGTYGSVFLDEYKKAYPGCEILDEGSLYTAGENEFATQSLSVSVNGTSMTVVILYGIHDATLYNMVFTVADMMLEVNEDYANNVVETIAASYQYGVTE